jgi:hypothetical protein
MEEHNSPVISKQVLEMITLAHEYCLFFEKAEQYSDRDILNYFQKIAPLMYLKGSLLPADTEPEPEYMERFVTEEQWEAIFKSLREKLQQSDTFYIHDHNYDTLKASLSENMADIYQDMKDFVMLYQKAPIQSKTCAVAELQQLYENHWGITVIQSLSAVHSILYKEIINPDLLPDEPFDGF